MQQPTKPPTSDKRDEVIIYTDGACSGNPGPGGWGAILIHQASGTTKELSGGSKLTTNNRMEITAALEALKQLKRPVNVLLHSDSAYLIKAFTAHWLSSWQRNGWKTSMKKPVENRDLWEQLLLASAPHTITWIHVRGHQGVDLNERCDALARAQAAAYKK